MKISAAESNRAWADGKATSEKILPEVRPRVGANPQAGSKKDLSPLERGMLVAEAALKNVPDVREDLVDEIKRRIEGGSYNVSAEDIAEMMLRRLSADRIR
ncbi:MAG: flagellar biosynthesis anti-sigma factor FlgM [Armatimonadota bacterium]|nr:flagellar biosynthesis anti-sigma factor FlgM [Armatimonadota bacterium]